MNDSIAIYMRVSKEELNTNESNSIKKSKAFIDGLHQKKFRAGRAEAL